MSNTETDSQIIKSSDDYIAKANIQDANIYDKAAADPKAYWEECANNLDWFEKWNATLEWNPPFAKWFIGGKLNASYNCLDRHIKNGLGDKIAIYWEAETGEGDTITYQQAYDAVNKFANGLKKLGVRKGDRVAIYMPMIPEAAYAMLACARIGAIHSVVFGGFSSDSLRDRIQDAACNVLITADGGYRRGKTIALKDIADQALEECPTINNVVVVERTKEDIHFNLDKTIEIKILANKEDKTKNNEIGIFRFVLGLDQFPKRLENDELNSLGDS